MNLNEITLKTFDYIEKTRGLGLADRVIKKTLEYIGKIRKLNKETSNYIEKKRRLEEGVINYNDLIR